MLHIILDSGPFVYLERCQLPIMGCYGCHCFCGYWHFIRCCMGNTKCGWLDKLPTATTIEVFAHGKIKELNRTITLFLKLSPFVSLTLHRNRLGSDPTTFNVGMCQPKVFVCGAHRAIWRLNLWHKRSDIIKSKSSTTTKPLAINPY